MVVKFCKGHKGEFECDENYEFSCCPKCKARGELNRQNAKNRKISCSYTNGDYKCTKGVKNGIEYCGKHIDIMNRLNNEKKGIFICSSRYSCSEQVEEKGKKCRKCLDRTKEYDTNRRKDAENNPNLNVNNGPHMKLCTAKSHWKPLVDFINEKGIECKQCKGCRDSQKKQDEKRKNRKRNWKEELEKNPARKAKKEEWKKNNYEICAAYWMKYRAKKMKEDPEGYRKHNAEVMKTYRENNPEKIEEIRLKSFNNSLNKLKIYKYESVVKNIPWLIDDNKAIELMQQECFYCGDKENGQLNGIDRMDNRKGYEISNVCGCCKMCNFMKKVTHWIVFIKRCYHITVHNLTTQCDSIFKDCEYIMNNINVVSYNPFPEVFCNAEFGASYADSKRRIINKKLDFNITEELFFKLKNEECYLCGKKSDEYHYNGIDRIDNNKGYIKGNIKSCCCNCNYMKWTFNLNDFMNKCKKISQKHIETKELFYDIKLPYTYVYDEFNMHREKIYVSGEKLKILRIKQDKEWKENYSEESIKNRSKKLAEVRNLK